MNNLNQTIAQHLEVPKSMILEIKRHDTHYAVLLTNFQKLTVTDADLQTHVDAQETAVPAPLTRTNLNLLTLKELAAKAQQLGIQLTGRKKKKDYINAILGE